MFVLDNTTPPFHKVAVTAVREAPVGVAAARVTDPKLTACELLLSTETWRASTWEAPGRIVTFGGVPDTVATAKTGGVEVAVEVAVLVAVSVGVEVAEFVAVSVAVFVAVGVAVEVAVSVAVFVGVEVAVGVAVFVAVFVAVLVAVSVAVEVAVSVAVEVAVFVAVFVAVEVAVLVAVLVGVAVGCAIVITAPFTGAPFTRIVRIAPVPVRSPFNATLV